jgi:hypothetical protein
LFLAASIAGKIGSHFCRKIEGKRDAKRLKEEYLETFVDNRQQGKWKKRKRLKISCL